MNAKSVRNVYRHVLWFAAVSRFMNFLLTAGFFFSAGPNW